MKDIKFYREKLNQKKEAFYSNYETNQSLTNGEREENMGDLVDKATDDYTKEFLNNLSNSDLQILKLIDEALERIDTKDYGICLDCGEDINVKRLKAVPWAEFCLDCQEKKEQENK